MAIVNETDDYGGFSDLFPFRLCSSKQTDGLIPQNDKPLLKTQERTGNGLCRITPDSICIKRQAQLLDNAWPKESKNRGVCRD